MDVGLFSFLKLLFIQQLLRTGPNEGPDFGDPGGQCLEQQDWQGLDTKHSLHSAPWSGREHPSTPNSSLVYTPPSTPKLLSSFF